MGIEPNSKNIANLLKTAPLSSCEFSPGWNNSGWLADVLYIYPNKVKKQTFENNREAILQMKEQTQKANNIVHQSSAGDFEALGGMLAGGGSSTQMLSEKLNRDSQQKLMNAKQKSQSIYDMNVNRFQQFHDESVKKYNQWVKKRQEQNVDTLKRDNDSKKKNEMNLDLDYWKKKFLYPYALDTGPLKIPEN